MLAAKFVEAEIKAWIEDSRPNLHNPVEYLPILVRKIIEAYEEYNKLCHDLPSKLKARNKQIEYRVAYSCPDLDQDFSDFDHKDEYLKEIRNG